MPNPFVVAPIRARAFDPNRWLATAGGTSRRWSAARALTTIHDEAEFSSEGKNREFSFA
jgi:hypothetical protein